MIIRFVTLGHLLPQMEDCVNQLEEKMQGI